MNIAAFKFYLACVLATILFSPLYAELEEVPAKEVGFRLVGLNSVDFILKKEKNSNCIVRYRFGFAQIGLSPATNQTSFSFNASLAIGVEKRKELMSKTYFFHGWEPGLAINYNSTNKKGVGQFVPFVGYFIGFAHNFSDKFCMNLEIIPRISATINSGQVINKNNFRIDGSYNSNSIGLGFIYRIK
jgi:hypothetical protein